MRAVDANVLVRLIVRDDARQAADAEAFVLQSGGWVAHMVVAETVWVLSTIYEHPPAAVVTALKVLLGHQHLTVENPDIVAAALEQYQRHPRVDFFDYLVREVARQAGHLPLGTFDRQFAELDGVQKI